MWQLLHMTSFINPEYLSLSLSLLDVENFFVSNYIHHDDVKRDLQREAIVVDRMLKLMDDGASALSSMIQVI